MAPNGQMVGRYTTEALLKRAKEVVEEKGKDSNIFDEEAERDMPRLKKTGECTYILSYQYPIIYINTANN